MHRPAAIAIAVLASCVGQLDFEPAPPEPPVEPPPPPPATDVTVTVTDARAPIAGATVIFQAADGAVVAERATDAAGVARAALAAGGTVSVIRRGDISEVYTYMDVSPGDQLVLARPTAGPGATPVPVTLTMPSQSAYRVVTPCGEATGAGQVTLELSGCGAETDFFAEDLVEGGSFLAHAAIAPAIDFSLRAVRQNVDTTLAATNAPPNTPVTVEKRLVANGFEVFRSAAVNGQQTTIPNIGEATAEQLVVATFGNGLGGTQRVANREPYNAGTSTIDLATGLIPFVETATFDGITVAWNQSGPGTADLVVVRLDNKAGVVRTIAAPLAGTTLRVPTLPPSAALPDFPAGTEVTHAIAKVTGGYAAARAHVLGGSLLDAAPMASQISVATVGLGID